MFTIYYTRFSKKVQEKYVTFLFTFFHDGVIVGNGK